MGLLCIWLFCLLALASWYQNNFIHSFTQNQPKFLDRQFTENWFDQLLPLLPVKNSRTRVIQLWKPDCLCNRFASRHAINSMNVSEELNIEHITIIPNANKVELTALQALNPKTKIITLSTTNLKDWPSSPSVFVQGPLNKLLYFGPLGFGAFCSDSSTGAIEQQLRNISKDKIKAFFNVIGKGCFCSWDETPIIQ